MRRDEEIKKKRINTTCLQFGFYHTEPTQGVSLSDSAYHTSSAALHPVQASASRTLRWSLWIAGLGGQCWQNVAEERLWYFFLQEEAGEMWEAVLIAEIYTAALVRSISTTASA